MDRSDSRSACAHFAVTRLIGHICSWSTRRVAACGSHCQGGDGSLLFPQRLYQRSAPLTPPGSSRLHLQVLHLFCCLRPLRPGSAPGCLLAEKTSRRGRLRFILRTAGLHPPKWRARPHASTPRSPCTSVGCYKGDLAPPLAGLPPASRCGLTGRARGEFSLHVDHPLGFGKVRLQARVLLAQPGHLPFTRLNCGSAARCPQGVQCAFVTLSAPFWIDDVYNPSRRKRALRPSRSRCSYSAGSQLVLRRKHLPPAPPELLVQGCPRHSMPPGHLGCHHQHGWLSPRPPPADFEVESAPPGRHGRGGR
jgi:hypothetical protein